MPIVGADHVGVEVEVCGDFDLLRRADFVSVTGETPKGHKVDPISLPASDSDALHGARCLNPANARNRARVASKFGAKVKGQKIDPETRAI